MGKRGEWRREERDGKGGRKEEGRGRKDMEKGGGGRKRMGKGGGGRKGVRAERKEDRGIWKGRGKEGERRNLENERKEKRKEE